MYNSYGYDLYDLDMYDFDMYDHGLFSNSYNYNMFSGMMAIVGLIYFLLLAFVVVNYIIRSIGLYRIAKASGVSAPGLAWVPYAMDYVFGKVSGDIKLGKRTLKNTPLWLVLIPIIGGAIIGIFVVMMIFAIVFMSIASTMYELAEMATTMFFVSYILLIVIACVYSIFYYIVYGMTYFTVCQKYKDSGASVFSTLMALFVPLADAIILFKLGKEAKAKSEPSLQASVQYTSYAPTTPTANTQSSAEDEISSFLPKE